MSVELQINECVSTSHAVFGAHAENRFVAPLGLKCNWVSCLFHGYQDSAGGSVACVCSVPGLFPGMLRPWRGVPPPRVQQRAPVPPRRQRGAQSAAEPRPLVLWLEVGEGGGGGHCRQMFPLTQSHDPRPVQGESKTRPLVSTWEVNCPRPGGPSPATSRETQDGGGLARGITRSLEPLHHRRPCSSLSRNRVLGVCGCSAALQTS